MKRRDFLAGFGAYAAFLQGARAQGTSRAPKLKITAIRAARFRGMYNGFVRVYTDQGLTGTGQFVDTVAAEDVVNKHMAPNLKGRDPLDIEGIYFDMWNWVFIRGNGGPYLTAMSGVDMALWDLAGKAMGVPVYRLMGGRLRDKVAVYFDVLSAQQAGEVVRTTGVKAIKTTIDRVTRASHPQQGMDPQKRSMWRLTAQQIDTVVAYVAAVREAIGPKTGMALECHAQYDPESAIQVARAVERFNPMWLEEPTTSDNPDVMAHIRRSTRIPIACGENVYTRYGFRPFLEKQAVSVIQPDMAKCGGLLESRKIAAMAEIYGIPIAPHGMATPLGMAAYAHVCSTVPNFMILEWGPYLNKADEGIMNRPPYKDGFMDVLDAPGIGIELNQAAFEERLLPGYEFPRS